MGSVLDTEGGRADHLPMLQLGHLLERRATWWLAASLYLLLAAHLAWQRVSDPPSPDFGVFWEAGQRFAAGESLYPARPIDFSFLYPPFAALVFQPLALFSQPVATGIFHFVNLVLWPVAIGLTAMVLRQVAPGWGTSPWPVLLAAGLTLRFFLWNWVFVQTNELTFVLILVGLWAYLRQRDALAVVAITAAAFIKIVPAVFLVWLAIRGRRRTRIAIVPAVLLLLLVPLLWRGIPLGLEDISEYVNQFLAHYLGGGVRVRYDNFNLATLVYSWFVPLHHPAGVGQPMFGGGEPMARSLYQAAAVVLGSAYLITLVALRSRSKPVTAFELSAGFLVGLLLSGVTWNHHLVALLFVTATFFRCPWRGLPSRWRPAILVAYGLMIVQGLAGRDIAGSTLHDALIGYMTLGWTMLYLFVLCLALPWVAANTPAIDADSDVGT